MILVMWNILKFPLYVLTHLSLSPFQIPLEEMVKGAGPLDFSSNGFSEGDEERVREAELIEILP